MSKSPHRSKDIAPRAKEIMFPQNADTFENVEWHQRMFHSQRHYVGLTWSVC